MAFAGFALGSAFTGANIARAGMAAGAAAARNFASAGASSAFFGNSPLTRELSYRLNHLTPNMVAEPADVIRGYYAGRVSQRQMDWALAQYGIWWNGTAGNSANRQIWQQVIELDRPQLDVDFLRDQMWRTGGGYNELIATLRRKGLSLPDCTRWANAGHLPGASLIVSLFERGQISRDEALARLYALGFRNLPDRELMLSALAGPAPVDIITLLNRGIIDLDTANTYLHWTGLRRQEERDKILALRFQLPGPADLVHFSVRDVWDPAVVARWGYDSDFPFEFRHWMSQHGLDWGTPVPAPGGGALPAVTWPVAYWRSHWQAMSPTQAYLAYQRLRPEVIAKYRREFPDIRPFELQDLYTILKIADYPPGMRDALAAISRPMLNRVDIRRFYAAGVLTAGQLTERYQDLGYSLADAAVQARYTVSNVQASRIAALTAGLKGRIERAYRLGTINQGEAARQFFRTTLKAPAEVAAYAALAPGAQAMQALADPVTRAWIESLDLDIRSRNTERQIKAIRHAVMTGFFTVAQGNDALTRLGIIAARVQQYINSWTIEQWGKARGATVAMLLDWYRRRIIGEPALVFRLRNLGYAPTDIVPMIVASRQDVALQNQKALLALAKTRQERVRALKAQLAEIDRERRRGMRDLASHGSPAQLARWHSKGLIGRTEALTRLGELGWPLLDAERQLRDPATFVKPPPNGSGKSPAEQRPPP